MPPSARATSDRDILFAALWMSGAIVSFSMMAVAGREVSERHDTFELMGYRSAVGFLIMSVIFHYYHLWPNLKHARWDLHFYRNIFHFAGQNLWFYALTVLPFAQVFALEFTSPIWVLLLSPLFLSERFTYLRLLGGLLGFLGILIVARPFSGSFDPNLIFVASAAIGFAGTVILTKYLTRSESVASILWVLTAMQLVFGFICAGIDGQVTWPNAQTLPYIIAIGICGLSAHFSLTKALSLAPASFVGPFDYLRLPLIAFVGWLLYNEPLEIWVFVGAATIFMGNYINIRAQFQHGEITSPSYKSR